MHDPINTQMTPPAWTPLVSIGLPIYNSVSKFDTEDVFIDALNSLRAQDYPNIEIVIVDNASTDDTYEFCRRIAGQDMRIKLHRNSANIGIYENLGRSFDCSCGRYFMIASDDDSWERDCISRCVAELERDPGIDLCYPLFVEYNLVNNTQYPRGHLINDAFQSGWRRACHLLEFRLRPQTMIMGVFRSDAIRHLFPLRVIMNSDLLFLYEFVFRSRFKCIQEILGKKYVRPKRDASQYSAQRFTLPTIAKISSALGMVGCLFAITWRSNASLGGKILCDLAILKFLLSGSIYVLTLHKVRL